MNAMSKSLFRRVLPALATALALWFGAGTLAAATTLKAGLPAPSLAEARWFGGTPVTNFAPGQLYVVEFRAAAAGGRVAGSIAPSLATKYAGRVSIISVSVAEPGADLEKQADELAAFVRSQGEGLRYAVAADTANRPLFQTWLAASGLTNPPAAFVIGQDGTLAWLGATVKGLDDAIAGALVVGRFGNTNRFTSAELLLRQRVAALRRAGKPAEALAALDDAIAGNPILARNALGLRMSLLLQTDAPAARQEARKLAEGIYRNDPPMLSTLAGVQLAQRDPAEREFGLRLAERACEQTGYAEIGMVSVLARAQSATGNPVKAVETLETLIKKIESSGGADSRELRRVRTELAGYQKAAKLPISPIPADDAEGEPLLDPNQGVVIPR